MSTTSHSEDIVPMCLYINDNNMTSYLGLPTKVRENGQDSLICRGIPENELVAQFYIINPDFRPIPPGTELFCAKTSPNDPYSTISLDQYYDPFNIEEKCTSFIAWNDPAPYTTPLNVVSSGNNIYMYFGVYKKDYPGPEYLPLAFSPIHVLVSPKITGVDRIPFPKGVSGTFKVIDNRPEFLFAPVSFSKRCLPNPNGTTLGKCLVDTMNKYQPSLLEYIHGNPLDEIKSKRVIITCIFFLFLLIILAYYK